MFELLLLLTYIYCTCMHTHVHMHIYMLCIYDIYVKGTWIDIYIHTHCWYSILSVF